MREYQILFPWDLGGGGGGGGEKGPWAGGGGLEGTPFLVYAPQRKEKKKLQTPKNKA